MGLDITAYSKVKYLETLEYAQWEEKYYEQRPDTVYAYVDRPERAAPIVNGGVYEIQGECLDFRAGSYGGYNEWRDELSRLMLDAPARVVWSNPEEYQDKPFYELIHFSDCEGTIGSEVAQRLAAAFQENQGRADAHDNDWWREKYSLWRRAFELAADNGLVEFH